MEKIIEIVALVIAGPMVGSEIAVAAFTNPIFGRLPDEAYRQARSDGSRLLGRVMPFWYIGTLVVLIAAAVVTSNGLIITAAALMAFVVLLTVTLMVPINNRISAWSETADASRDVARRWDRMHWLRVAILVLMFVLLAVAVVR
ncbi:MAG: anthrone oxygenase family protein [Mycobacterium sp.]